MSHNITLGSLFDGIGGFPLAAETAGIKPVWASEIETTPISITKRHFPGMRHLGDITKINGGDIEPVDIITFGSPCQDLSTAGRRAGLDGKRSGLFIEAVRIIKEMRNATNKKYPTRIIWENVPGAFSSNGGGDFQKVIEEISGIAEAGISIPRLPQGDRWNTAGAVMGNGWSLAWRVLDARYWGVPQRRRRIFLVADFGSQRAGEILFKSGSVQGDIKKGGTEGKGTSGNTENHFTAAGFNGFRGVTGTVEYREDGSPCIQATMPPNALIKTEQFVLDVGYSTERIYMNPQSSVTLKANSGGNGGKTGLYCLPELHITENQNTGVPFTCNGFGDYKRGNTGKTIMARNDVTTSDLIVTNYAVRRLTPLECERLQGFPDGWTEFGHDGVKISDNQRYKALGNSVAIPCVEFVMRGINSEQLTINNEK